MLDIGVSFFLRSSSCIMALGFFLRDSRLRPFRSASEGRKNPAVSSSLVFPWDFIDYSYPEIIKILDQKLN